MPERLRSRKFWVTLISQVTALLVLFLPDHESIITEASTNIGALLLLALTSMGYVTAQGKVDAIAKGKQTALLLCALIPLSGCASTPEARWYQTRDGLTTASKVYIAHAKANTWDDEQLVKYGSLLKLGRAKLEEARLLLPEGGSEFDFLLNVVEDYLADLAEQEQTDDSSGNSSDPPNGPVSQGIRLDAVSTAEGRWIVGRAEEADFGRGWGCRRPSRFYCRSSPGTYRIWRVQHRLAA